MGYGEASYDGAVTAAGTLAVTFGPGARTRHWTVSQVSVEMPTAPLGCACDLRKSGRLVTPLVATGDVAGGDPPVVLQGADTLTVTWTGATPGDIGHVFVIYDDGV